MNPEMPSSALHIISPWRAYKGDIKGLIAGDGVECITSLLDVPISYEFQAEIGRVELE